MNPKTITERLLDIRIWICLFFVIRLIGITNPPLEVAHNWRQTTGTMVTRNFFEVSSNILYPRVDFAGDKSGITGMEFPLLNYVDYLVAEVFGYQHWYGRLVNLLVSSLGIWFFFLVIKKYFNKEVAFNASIVLLASIWFAYSRKIMPDTFATSLFIMGFYFGTNYFEKSIKRKLNLLLFFILTLFSILAKLPVGYLLIMYSLFIFNPQFSIKIKAIFIAATCVLLIPVCWWYFYWVPFLVNEYGFWHFFMGKSISDGATELLVHWSDGLKHFYDAALKYVGFFAFLVGFFFAIKQHNKKLLWIFTLSLLSFSVIMLKAGLTFTHHAYYIIPFVPIMALIAGYGIAQILSKKLQMVFIIAIVAEGTLNQMHDFRIKENEMAFVQLEQSLNTISNRNDLIAVNTGDNPTAIYFAHRKGWVAWNEELLKPAFQQELKSKGCKYIVVLKRYLGGELQLELPIVTDNKDWRVYALEK